MNTIKIRMLGENYYPTSTTFPGGEVHITLPKCISRSAAYSIKAKIKDSRGIMELLLVKEAMDQIAGRAASELILPYVPYARQDRVCNPGEALSIKVMARLINSMGFDKVVTYDNHSDVATALINNCTNLSAADILTNQGWVALCSYLCSPDAGANKKTYEVAKRFSGMPVICADKVRNTKTGEITHTEVHCEHLEGASVLVIDDICDGGMTFIKLAEALIAKGAGRLYLYVTHGIFSKGLEPLSAYERIFTTDSLRSAEDNTEILTVIKI